MGRLLIWFCGAVGLGYLCYRFAVWHLAAQMALLALTFLWFIVGAWLVSRQHVLRDNARRDTEAMSASARAASTRIMYSTKFGEDKAAQIDRDDPGFWVRVSSPREAAK
jgi:hypothetical protein